MGPAPAPVTLRRVAASHVPGAPSATFERSRSRLAAAVLVLGALGGILLALTELSTIVSIDVLTGGTCEELADPAARDACKITGFEQHGGALLLLGGLAVVMAFGASRRASRPAAVALLVVAAVALALTVSRDIPKADDTGEIGLRYDAAEASPGAGLYMEVVGAGLCALAGLARLTRST